MPTAAIVHEGTNLEARAASAQRYARLAGLLFLISFIGGGFGEAYVPMKLVVSGDPAATASNILAHEGLFRLGFAGFLVESLCDIILAGILYVLLKPAGQTLALMATLLRVVSTAVFAVAELFYYAPWLVLGSAPYLKAFSPEQLTTMGFLSLRLYGFGAGMPMAHYGLAWVLFGILMMRSGYFPKLLGALLALAGIGFTIRAFLLALAPRAASDFLLLPMILAGLGLAGWLLIRGVDVVKWKERAEGEQAF